MSPRLSQMLHRGGLRLLAIALLGLLCTWGNAAQTQDSIALRRTAFEGTPVLLGAGLLSVGTVFTVVPSWHEAVQIPNRRYAELGWQKYRFDDYLQYAPAALPFVLKACGLRGEHSFWHFSLLAALSYGVGGGVALVAKENLSVARPSGLSFNSFPSGHTLVSFVGAELVRREYGREYPWVAVGAYTVAAATAFMRFHNDMHWLSDIAAGIGIALLSVSFSYGLDIWWENRRARRSASADVSFNISTLLCDGYILQRF